MVKSFVTFVILALTYAEFSGAQMIEPKFAEAYNRWAEMNQRTRPNDTINAQELLAWQDVKSEWRKLEKTMDRHYRAER